MRLKKERGKYFSDYETMKRIISSGKVYYENEFFKIVDSVFVDKKNPDNMVYLDEIFAAYSGCLSDAYSFGHTCELILHTSRGIKMIRLPHVTEKEADNLARILVQFTPNALAGYNRKYIREMKQKKKLMDASRNLNTYEAAFKDYHYIPEDVIVDEDISIIKSPEIYEKLTLKKRIHLVFTDQLFSFCFMFFIIAFLIFICVADSYVIYNYKHLDLNAPDYNKIKRGVYIAGSVEINYGSFEGRYDDNISSNRDLFIIPCGDKWTLFYAANNDAIDEFNKQRFMMLDDKTEVGVKGTTSISIAGKFKSLNEEEMENYINTIKERIPNVKMDDIILYYIEPDYSLGFVGTLIGVISGSVVFITLIIMILRGKKINRVLNER